MSRSTVLLFLALSAWPSISQAQVARYNPYAPSQEDPSPLKADGSVNWPRYFKSVELESRFQSYFQMGACVGTKKAINDRLSENAVDVNALPTMNVDGRIVGRVGNTLFVQTDKHEPFAVITHPAGVSDVKVEGTVSAGRLRPGMTIRTLGKVGQNGKQNEPLVAVDIISPTANRPKDVKADRSQAIVATIEKVHGDHLHVRVPTGTLRNLTLPFDDSLTVNVDASNLELADLGDRIIATGHVLSVAGNQGRMVFAGEVSVKKSKQ